MRMGNLQAAVIALALTASGCMLSPTHGSVLCGANANVTFAGYVTQPGVWVTFSAAKSAAGPFTVIGSVKSSTSPGTYAGTTLYGYSKQLQIPIWNGAESTLRTFIRAHVATPYGNANLTTFDVETASGQKPVACLSSEVDDGALLADAVAACASDSSPIVELTAPALSTCACTATSVRGDVVIDDAIDAANRVCMQTLTGSLTVLESAPRFVHLPVLTQVSGDAHLEYGYATGVPGPPFRTRTLALPVLTTIGGHVELTARTNDAPPTAPVGLHAVTSIGGDLSLTLYGTNPDVFDNLTHMSGDPLVQGWTGAAGNLDIGGSQLLPAMTSMDGSLTVQGFYTTTSLFNQLETVGGDVRVERVRFYASPSFQSLETVGGDLQFVALKQAGPSWPALTSVGGELLIADHTTTTQLSTFPFGSAAVHALRIENNAALGQLDGDLQVGAGNIEIHANPAITQCALDAFVLDQLAGGFSGSVDATEIAACP